MRLFDFYTTLRRLFGEVKGISRPGVVVVGIGLTGILAGLASTALLAVINLLLSESGEGRAIAGRLFLALCIVLPTSRFLSNFLLVRLAQGVNYDLRLRLGRRVLAAPLRHLERVGPGRLLATLTDDIQVMTAALTQVPTLCLQLTVVIGCLIYMAWLSWPLLLVVLGFVVLGVLSYQLPAKIGQVHFRRSRERWDDVVHYFRGLVEGTKELKVNRKRRHAFLDDRLDTAAADLRDHAVTGGTIYAAANSFGQSLFFILIGLLLFFGIEQVGADREVATGFTLAILYMLTPLDVLLNMMPALGRALVAAEKVEKLGLSLEDAADDEGDAPISAAADGWQRLTLSAVTHTYFREDENDTFTLGPIDLEIERGELLFVTGGNGSGKTTLAKLLIGLYFPQDGEVRVDGEAVTAANRDNYRQLFSVVFSDFFLFESLLGVDGSQMDEEARRYLEKLHLQHKVQVREGELSTLDLSQGQRKRLALLTAYIEDRPVFLFDEWAADQDPVFKEIFYCQLLPGLQRRGKTVVVISHDDRYYPQADRLVKLEYGQKVYDGPPGDEGGHVP